MHKRVNLAVALLACVFVVGCGTTANVVQIGPQAGHAQMRVYGGVLYDIKAWDAIREAFSPDAGSMAFRQAVFAACYLMIDLPLSAIADTLLLPLVLRSEGRPLIRIDDFWAFPGAF